PATGRPGAAPLTRVRFSRDDLLLTRFAEAPAPLVEGSAGLLEMRRRPAVLSRWAVRARRAFPPTARPLLDLVPPALPSPTFVDPAVPDLEEGLEIVRATPARVVAEEVATCWRGAGPPPGGGGPGGSPGGGGARAARRPGSAPSRTANRRRWRSWCAHCVISTSPAWRPSGRTSSRRSAPPWRNGSACWRQVA